MTRWSWWKGALLVFGILAALWLSPLILCTLQMAVEMPVNSVRLWFFGRDLFEYPLPPRTEELDRKSEVGLLVGNSNHCDYLAERVLATQLTREEITAHFGKLATLAVFDDTPMPDGRMRVVIRRFRVGDPPGADIRCH